jgi:hypothetical protein
MSLRVGRYGKARQVEHFRIGAQKGVSENDLVLTQNEPPPCV